MYKIDRLAIKICGESGQGINSIGEVVARALKKSGFYTFGYREYPSLIKGGHASVQIDFADHSVNAPSRLADVLVCFSRVAFHAYLPTIAVGGQVIHMLQMLELSEVEQQMVIDKKIRVVYLPADVISQEVGGRTIMANSVMVGALWQLTGFGIAALEEVVRDEFATKPDYIEPNVNCLKRGYEFNLEGLSVLEINFLVDEKRKNDALLTGNHLVSLGAVAAGVRAYFAYPMTPSSSILTYMADIYHQTGMLVKQVDDEISVAQMAIGAMFMGTRALVATSGGGFDLMTESVTLSAITETPFVCILAQRPGPATGLPTWTAASDLNLAVYAGHGEFARCVIAISDSRSAYAAIQNAFNLAEKYQLPVVVLTDKQIAESLFQVDDLGDEIEIERNLESGDDLKKLVSGDRFELTETGISPRWLPGQLDATFVANSDEHLTDGTVTEDAETSLAMQSKRLRKLQTLLDDLPEPKLVGPEKAKLTFVGWGSVKNTIEDVATIWNGQHPKKAINFLHYEYVYPVKVEKFKELIRKKQPLVLLENNALGQLGGLLTQQTGHIFVDRLLKFDGRPFFIEDIMEYLEGRLGN
jgi:2-oxoglutarate ferredoxin oxidoreductase subunit alpha